MRRAIGLAGLLLAVWGAPAGAATHTITFGFTSYSPNDLVWRAGDTVTFSGDFGPHPLRWDNTEFADGNANPDFSGKPAGGYRYYCLNHGAPGGAGMSGIVRKPDGSAPATPSLSHLPQSPQTGQAVTFSGTPGFDAYEWDLDGNGSFERRTPGASTSITYTTAGDRTVRLRVTELDGDVSPAAEDAVSVAQAPSTGGGTTTPPPSGGGGGTTTPPPSTADPAGTAPPAGDTVKPVVTQLAASALAVKGRAKLRFRTDEPGRANATLKVKGKLVGSGSLTIARAGAQSLTITLNKRGRDLLRRGRVKAALRLEVRDRASNLRVRSASLTVRRA